ncbi:MAG: hypothetical protein A2233_01175 [Candidatus Kerfeldbacteria bacterium RIFOXYA2_FULL_38_24]|nr:MAG: hypothetical protein A2233_01175 [Candidatus Kerfeldbacteria bacterium RIFOXYA2_FULL_38_24]OGY88518.1 MAG: hypothetical protein A2458_00180 [Candidatus Kerfeldbacteria bacterium RIFOXYC2_FULL_38_9]
MNNEEIKSQAIIFAKKNKKRITYELTDRKIYKSDDNAVSVFMAGSPGAGKTEFSKNLIAVFEETTEHKVIRIDGDEIRARIPGYTGSNSFLFQGAISIIVDKIHDMALAQKQTFILDGTFSQYDKALQNIKRSLNKHREVFIFYIYQEPQVAWEFTKTREEKEGRNIPKDKFIEQFFGAEKTASRLRKEFGKEVTLFLVKKNYQTNSVENIVKIEQNGKLIDDYIKESYTVDQMKKLL